MIDRGSHSRGSILSESEAQSGLVVRTALLVAGRIRAHCGFGPRESNTQCRGNGGDG